MVSITFLKIAIKLLFHNPVLFKSLFQCDIDKIYSSYLSFKLDVARKYYDEFKDSDLRNRNEFLEFITKLNKKILKNDHTTEEAFFIPLYFIIRKMNPKIVIETGIQRGVSSFFILNALEDNKNGKLYSIDLPLTTYQSNNRGTIVEDLPTENVGMYVPVHLRKRWELVIGDSKVKLPKLLQQIGDLDVFYHDSEHTYKHMMWEFETAWPYIKKGGTVLSDDTSWNKSFYDFAKKVNCKCIELRKNRTNETTFGLLLKN